MKNFLFLISIVLASGCAMTTERTHPALHEELKKIERVVIAPPQITIELVKLGGDNERLTEKEQALGEAVASFAAEELVAAGYEVVDFDLQSAIENDADLAYLVTQIREGFEVAKKDLKAGQPLSKSKSNIIKAQVGEAVTMVSSQVDADAVLLVSVHGYEKSGGSIAKDVGTSVLVGVLTMGAVVPVQQTQGAMAEAALIDGITGEVLWTDIRQGAVNEKLGENIIKALPRDIDHVVPVETNTTAAAN